MIRWRQFRGRLQFLSSLSGSTTGIQSSSSTSRGVWWVQTKNHRIIYFNLHWKTSFDWISLKSVNQYLEYFKDFPLPWFPPPPTVVDWIQRAQQDLTCRLRVGKKWSILWLCNTQVWIMICHSGMCCSKFTFGFIFCLFFVFLNGGCCIPTILLMNTPACQTGNVIIWWVRRMKVCFKEKQKQKHNITWNCVVFICLCVRVCVYISNLEHV